MVLDALADGVILSKSYNEAYEILESIASNNYQWSNARASTSRKVAGVLEVDALTALTAQVSSMTNFLKNMSLGGMVQPATMGQVSNVSCVYCGDGHTFESCPSNPASICYVGNQNANRNNPYSNSYNPGWRQHPNFSWGVKELVQEKHQCKTSQHIRQGFLNNHQECNNLLLLKNDAVIQSQAASLRNLEIKMGQLANELRNRPQGTLPNDTKNPRRDGKEQCKVVTLRNGKNLELNGEKDKRKNEPTSIQIGEEKSEKSASSAVEFTQNATASVQQSAVEKCLSEPPPPFPQRFQKQQQDGQFRRFLDVLKQLHINIPLVETLEQMPNYVKFLKDILTKKRRLGEFGTVALTEGCTAILKNKIPPKLKDPGSFTIPISIGGREVEGKIEDVLVQVDKFIFPADFIILDYEEDKDVFNPIRSPNEVEACLAISASNFKLIEKMHGKYSNGVKKKVPFEEIEKGGEPWISKEKKPSHSPKLPKKRKKKKKHSINPQSQMLEVGNRVFF
ncbi:uncharacterized protein LOC133832069 [Humulus lupulus]|uniref:uncharacterized protein LOC133832069 n=1 Tax=Humulus lupulus TaxID=3486 RepID=UPI002B410B56|nr:uncharacterized protein LOC133832069 [Humulus lupulus]